MMDDRAADPFAALRAARAEDWRAYVEHDFVRRLAAGTLPAAAFRHYLIQDYLFLLQFARAFGLAVFKASAVDELRAAARGLSAILDQELDLHLAYCAEWGLSEADVAAQPEARATIAYTRFVLDAGVAGDLLDLQVALEPCVIGYAEIGRRLIRDPATVLAGNPYRPWIETYAADAYQEVARAHRARMGTLLDRRGGPGRWPSLVALFATATRLEADFWRMALDAAP